MRDLVAGLYFVISAAGPRPACPCGLVFDFVAKWIKKWFCEILDDRWLFLDEFWWVLVSFPMILKGFMGFRWFLGAAGPPVPIVPLAFVFLVFGGGFKEHPPPKPPYQALGWSYSARFYVK